MSAFTFFFTEASPFSNWYPCRFVDEDVEYNCTEQHMMRGKALLFGDSGVAAEIMAAAHPREHKALGRKVKNFDDAAWKRERVRIVTAGNRAKFTQNPELLEALLATKGTTLVEASPYDKIWGIGLDAKDPRANDPTQWKGQNLLGQILTELRDELLAR